VIFVPGLTGSKLRQRGNGEVMWGEGSHIFKPRDGGYAIARPLHLRFDDPTDLESFEVIYRLNLGFLIKREVYGAILDMLVDHGYSKGQIEAPDSRSNLYLFHYDWRQDNILAVKKLFQNLERLRVARGEDQLEVDLLCQSNGAYICRYLAKYGPASLTEAEAGGAHLPPRIHLRKVVLMGSSNGGSLRNLREIHRGRTYIPLIGRWWLPETLFTCPSLFQDLPVYRQDFFLDGDGKRLTIDLFEAENWRRYGWSIFSPEARSRLQENPRLDLFSNEATQLAYLRRSLKRAKRIQNLLHRDTDLGDLRLYSIQSRSNHDTPDRAVLLPNKGQWQLLFPEDRELDRQPFLRSYTATLGDGHASLASQKWLAPTELAAMAHRTFYSQEGHFELILAADTLRFLLEILADPLHPTSD
jgi:hypothetical protein